MAASEEDRARMLGILQRVHAAEGDDAALPANASIEEEDEEGSEEHHGDLSEETEARLLWKVSSDMTASRSACTKAEVYTSRASCMHTGRRRRAAGVRGGPEPCRARGIPARGGCREPVSAGAALGALVAQP